MPIEFTDDDQELRLQVALEEIQVCKRDYLAAELRWKALPEDQQVPNHPEQNTMDQAEARYSVADAEAKALRKKLEKK